MGLREELQAQRDEIDSKLAILNRVPADTFPFGTIMVFAPQTGKKWFYIKVAEEGWQSMKGGSIKDLATWVFETHEMDTGYFEVYRMRTDEVPIYASA